MKFLAVVTPPPAIYHGCSIQKTFWENNFTPVNMKSCGGRNVRKHKKIKSGEQNIILEISSNIDCLVTIEFTSSESKYYMERPCKGVTTYLSLKMKISKKKHKARFSTNNITNQDFRNLLKKFKNSPYLGSKIK